MTQRKSSAEIAVAQDVGGRIRYLRGSLSQAEFAAKLGITRAALANYELGRSLAPDHVLDKIREVTGGVIDPPVDVDELRKRLVNEFGFVQRSAITDDEWAVVRTLRALSNEEARQVISELLDRLEAQSEDQPVSNAPAFAADLARLYKIVALRRRYNDGADRGLLLLQIEKQEADSEAGKG